jgi:hypothetical protein
MLGGLHEWGTFWLGRGRSFFNTVSDVPGPALRSSNTIARIRTNGNKKSQFRDIDLLIHRRTLLFQ